MEQVILRTLVPGALCSVLGEIQGVRSGAGLR